MTKVDRPPGGVESVASPTFTGTVTADAIVSTGNTTLGNAAADTFKTHATAESGLQAAFVATPAALTGGESPTEAEHNALRDLCVGLKAAVVNAGLMAAS